MMEEFLPGFSIVLCTYNGQSRLKPTLQHIAAIKVPDGHLVELVLVNNASSDKTEFFVKEQWEQLGSPFSLILINENRPGKGYAVETGFDAARYSYILTVDDDNWLSSDYLTVALPILQNDSSIGALLGKSIGVFEQDPPAWFHQEGIEHFFVIGGPINKPGYFPKNNFGTWGAGMIIRKQDWNYLRDQGFTFLTSKLPGKAAGEDHELGRALLMLDRTLYYSDQLTFQHYMPAERVNWLKLKQNFETFGYVSHYNFLFALALDAQQKGYELTKAKINKAFVCYLATSLRRFTIKQYLAYWMRPQEQYYQLKMVQYFSHYQWFFRLHKKAPEDVQTLNSWMAPIIRKHSNNFKWTGKVY